MRKILTFGLFIFCTFLLQSTWPVVIRIGYVPDLLLILVVSMAFMRGRRSGMLFGMICGILADLCYMPFLGFSALLFTLTGYLAGGTFDVFYGPIVDNKGNLRVAEGEGMPDELMLNEFDWYVEGVVIDE